MNFEEIEELLQYNEKESKIFIPNEIFEDLINKFQKLKPKEKPTKTVTTSKGRGKNKGINISHIAFAYSYYYLISWLYRYCKHLYGYDLIDNEKVKEILGYNATTKGIDYLIKNNGLLDTMGYIKKTKDIPISSNYDEFDGLSFTLLSDLEEEMQKMIKEKLSRKYSIKYPIKAFERVVDEEGNIEQEGTFFEFENTHCIPFEVFIYSMSNENIGTIGFYLYTFIKMMNDRYSTGWDVSIENLVRKTQLPESTLLKYLDIVKKYRMITTIHNQEYFCLALDPKDRKANTYIANDFDLFTYKPQAYQKIEILTANKHYEKVGKDLERITAKKIDIPLSELPY